MKPVLYVAVLVLMGATAVRAAQSGAQRSASAAESPAKKYFTNVELIDANERPLRFYDDLLKGKTVIINVFFTTCVSVCPPMNKNLEKVQEWLGDRLGKEAVIISISVDPLNDTPPLLKEYAKRFNARPGWYFLTGKKENVELALRKLGQYVEARDDHSSIMIVGNEATGLWKKAFGLAKPEELIKVVETVLNDRGDPEK